MGNQKVIKSGIYSGFIFCFFLLYNTGISVFPQLPGYLLIGIVLFFLNSLFGILTAGRVFADRFKYINIALVLFIALVFMTMLIRGIGFEFLGSNKSGGMFYIRLFTTLLLVLTAANLPEKEKANMNLVFLGFLLASVLPFLSDAAYFFLGESNILSKFVEGSTTITDYSESFDAGELFRIQSASLLATSLFTFVLIYKPFITSNGKFSFTMLHYLLFFICIVAAGISGHRLAFFEIGLIVALYYSLIFGFRKIAVTGAKVLVVAVIACVFIIVFYEHLPAPVQRVFTFLPYTPETNISNDISASNLFRVLMLGKGIAMIPDYFFIGKGFAFVNYHIDIHNFYDVIDEYAEIGVFHNGIMGLIVNLGVLGLILGIIILVSISKKALKTNYYTFPATMSERVHLAIRVKLLIICVFFVFFYGDIQTNFIDLLVLFTFYKMYDSFFYNSKEKAAII